MSTPENIIVHHLCCDMSVNSLSSHHLIIYMLISFSIPCLYSSVPLHIIVRRSIIQYTCFHIIHIIVHLLLLLLLLLFYVVLNF
jgi:hypothetical protein